MWLFFVIIVFLILCRCVYHRNDFHSRKLYIVCAFLLLAALGMFKADTVGNDTHAYISLYGAIGDGFIFSLNNRFEIGFLALCKILRYFYEDPQILFIVCSVYCFGAFGYIIYKFCPMPCMATLLFFVLYFDLALSGLRQTMAIATIALSFRFIVYRHKLMYLFFNILGTLFHNSALCFLIAYPLSLLNRYRASWKIISTLFTIIILLMFEPIIKILLELFPRYNYYVSGTYMDGHLRLASLINFIQVTCLYILSYLIDNNYKSRINKLIETKQTLLITQYGYNIVSNLSFISCLFSLISFKATILSRFTYIAGFFIIIYYSNMLSLISNRTVKFIGAYSVLSVVIIYKLITYIVRPWWSSTYPYTFFWQ